MVFTCNPKLKVVTGRRGAQVIGCQPVIENCIVADNQAAALEGDEPLIRDSLIEMP